jgi:probable rRNA maturation factor
MLIYIDSEFEDNIYFGICFDEPFFYSIVSIVAEDIKFSESAELSLVLTEDAFIRSLNLEFRGLNRPTDVLSFPQEDDILLGDIVISLETANRKAEAAGIPLEEEVAFLFIHGLLHLKGYDHESEEGEEEMFDLQEKCLERWKARFRRAE